MKLAFRIECPHCKWGYPWSDTLVNMGWVYLVCQHCNEKFYTKISIPSVNVECEKDMPNLPIYRPI